MPGPVAWICCVCVKFLWMEFGTSHISMLLSWPGLSYCHMGVSRLSLGAVEGPARSVFQCSTCFAGQHDPMGRLVINY